MSVLNPKACDRTTNDGRMCSLKATTPVWVYLVERDHGQRLQLCTRHANQIRRSEEYRLHGRYWRYRYEFNDVPEVGDDEEEA